MQVASLLRRLHSQIGISHKQNSLLLVGMKTSHCLCTCYYQQLEGFCHTTGFASVPIINNELAFSPGVYIEDICFFEVNTKYISSGVLKTSEFS